MDVPPAQLWEHQWEQFLTEYYSLTQGGAKIQVSFHNKKSIKTRKYHYLPSILKGKVLKRRDATNDVIRFGCVL